MLHKKFNAVPDQEQGKCYKYPSQNLYDSKIGPARKKCFWCLGQDSDEDFWTYQQKVKTKDKKDTFTNHPVKNTSFKRTVLYFSLMFRLYNVLSMVHEICLIDYVWSNSGKFLYITI